MTRVIAVLGHADGGTGRLHPIAAARIARAAEIATTDDVVVLSGWARVPGTPSEAALMRAAWRGHAARVVVDEDARTTAENAAHVSRIARGVGAAELVVVTSAWHAPRALTAFRILLRGSGIRVRGAPVAGAPLRRRVRETWLLALLPAQLARAARRRPSE